MKQLLNSAFVEFCESRRVLSRSVDKMDKQATGTMILPVLYTLGQ